jgi:hypothetical protein
MCARFVQSTPTRYLPEVSKSCRHVEEEADECVFELTAASSGIC